MASSVWAFFFNLFHLNPVNIHTVSAMLQFWRSSTSFISPGHIRMIIPILVFWHIWEARNDMKYRNKRMSHRRIQHKIIQHIHYIFLANKLSSQHWRGDRHVAAKMGWHIPYPSSPPPKIVTWIRPNAGEWKLNTDGAVKGNNQMAGVGGLLRVHHGNAIFAFLIPLTDCSSIEAELWAILHGVHLSIHKGFTRLWLETDSKAAEQLINGSTMGPWRIRQLLNSLREVVHHFHIQVTHTYREGNQPADELANMACMADDLMILTPNNFPTRLKGLIRLDRWNFPSFRFR